MVRVGVVSRDDLDGTCLVTDVVMRFVTTVCFLPLGSVTVILSPLASFLRAAFLLAIADWVSVVKEAMARPGPIPRRSLLVRPEAVRGDNRKNKKEKKREKSFNNKKRENKVGKTLLLLAIKIVLLLLFLQLFFLSLFVITKCK